jgi:uncharacterized membrane protein YdbT with pleckstrin-like domain
MSKAAQLASKCISLAIVCLTSLTSCFREFVITAPSAVIVKFVVAIMIVVVVKEFVAVALSTVNKIRIRMRRLYRHLYGQRLGLFLSISL